MNTNFMSNMFGKIAPGMCRMSIDGKVAVKTANGYKTYDVNTGSLVNCDDFCFNIGEEFFFLIPTNKVEKGDIILASGKPCCVIEAKDNTIQVLRYEDSSISTIVPENHMFMGKTYFYGKIVSMFGNMMDNGDSNQMMKYMMMSSMIGGNKNSNMDMSSMMPMLFMMNGGMDNMFKGMFDAPKDTSKEDK